MTAQDGAEGARRVEADLSAPSLRPDDGDGTDRRDERHQPGELLGFAVVFRQHSAAEIRSWLAGCDVLGEGDAARAAVEAEEHTPFEAVVCELRAVDRDEALRRAAAGELAALTEELGLYDDGDSP